MTQVICSNNIERHNIPHRTPLHDTFIVRVHNVPFQKARAWGKETLRPSPNCRRHAKRYLARDRVAVATSCKFGWLEAPDHSLLYYAVSSFRQTFHGTPPYHCSANHQMMNHNESQNLLQDLHSAHTAVKIWSKCNDTRLVILVSILASTEPP